MIEIKGKYTTAKIMIDDVEEACLQQIHAMTNHVAFDQPIVIQADTHAGRGSVIGFCMPLGEKIIANVVGSDIGCGVLTVNVGDQISLNKDKLFKIEEKIRNIIPMGSNIQKRSSVPSKYFEKNFPFDVATETARKFIMKYNKKFNTDFDYVRFTYDWFLNKQKEVGMRQDAELAISSMGGNNHFVEIGISENTGDAWITVHSGSRNFGKMICDFHQKTAKTILDNKRKVILTEKIKEIKEKFPGRDIPNEIKKAKKDLGLDFDFNINHMEFLEGQDGINYFMDMIFAQKYANFNRTRIIELITNAIGVTVKETIHSIHNFIDFNDMIIRKGAISSYEGQKMVIPFTMKDGLLICEGKSNSEFCYSAPHGAGRLMSRGAAKNNIDFDKYKESMKGIVTTSVTKSSVDEAPGCYKNPKMIEAAIEPTATILDRVKPILNLKDIGESMTWKERRLKEKKEKSRKNDRKQTRRMKGNF